MDYFLLLMLMPALITGNASNVSTVKNESTTSIASTAMSALITSGVPDALPPAVGRITVKWNVANSCQGAIQFSVNFKHKMLLCNNNYITNNYLGIELCKQRRCGDFRRFEMIKVGMGYMIHENLTASNSTQCNHASLICEDAYNSELVAYKIMTGLLLTLIIAVLLCRFFQPTYIAVRKRFSQKRQDRWIGPTQSQSVSYHKRQTGHPSNNTNRQSYPGLERLSVNPSREPSSNRNSDYDSYGA